MSDEKQKPPEATRMGSRWLHLHPSEEQVRDWFSSQRLHTGMTHDPYLGGIVVIGATEKVKATRLRADGATFVQEVEQAVFVPYVKVDTRIAYFRDYVRVLNSVVVESEELEELMPREFGAYYGVIRPVPQIRITDEASPYYNGNLPDGFSIYPVRANENNVSRFLVATFEVVIYKRGAEGKPDTMVLRGQGSKQTAQKRQYPDDNAIMKAETGAIGRALGVAGMLVVGTGVATAEDVQEAISTPSGASTGASAAQLPSDVPQSDVTTEEMIAAVTIPADQRSDAIGGDELGGALQLPDDDGELRKMAGELNAELKAHYPVAWGQYIEWWGGRGFGRIEDLSGPALKGAVIKLQRDLDERKQAGLDIVAES